MNRMLDAAGVVIGPAWTCSTVSSSTYRQFDADRNRSASSSVSSTR
jgi:hypothetical protein